MYRIRTRRFTTNLTQPFSILLHYLTAGALIAVLTGCGTGTGDNTADSTSPVGAEAPPPASYALRTVVSGEGSVTSQPAGISCNADCTASFNSESSVLLIATPAAGSTFAGWGGNCTGTGNCTVVMTAARDVTATFVASTGGGPVFYSLNISKTGSGTITSNPAGINCGATCSASYAAGTAVTLNATAASGYTFTGWSGICSGTGGCNVSMTATRNVSATFTPNTPTSYTLTVSKNGSGTVTSNPAGINCGTTCSASYATGISVTLTASAAAGYTFGGWSGSGCSGNGACTVSMTQGRSVSASFTADTASADLCDGLVTDKVPHPMTALDKPVVGGTVSDPQFGTTIRRITNVGGTGIIKPAYSTVPAWNADESYLILYHTNTSNSGHHLYNGKTYQYIKKLEINPPDLEQFYWHTTDPDVLFYVDSSTKTLTRYRVGTGTKEAIKVFSCASGVSGGTDPMFMSWDSDVIGLRCSSGYVFTYRISTDTIGTTLNTTSTNAPIASASGTTVFFANGGNAEVRDLDLKYLRGLPIDPNEHASLGRLANGRDTHNAVSFGGTEGSLVTTDMTDGTVRTIVGPATGYPYPPGGTHVSALAFKKPGWVALSIVGNTNGTDTLNQELVLADSNAGGKVCRVGHHRSWGKAGPRGYWAEPHVVISPSGTRLLFGSDWGGGLSVDTYVVELPSYRQ